MTGNGFRLNTTFADINRQKVNDISVVILTEETGKNMAVTISVVALTIVFETVNVFAILTKNNPVKGEIKIFSGLTADLLNLRTWDGHENKENPL